MELFRFTFECMSCSNEVQIFAAGRAQAEAQFERMRAEVQRIEKKYSRYDSGSVVSLVNAAAGQGRSIELDEETAGVVDYAATLHKESSGLFDITSGVLRRVWNFREPRVPSQAEIEAILPLIGWQKVKWQRPEICLPYAGMEIDLGGLGKEYAVDRACGLALEDGVRAGLVNLGGDVRAFGKRPDGQAWLVGIVHPRNRAATLTSIRLESGSLATSGDYERFFEIGEQRYCHILNPLTGWPVSDLQSASVIAQSCLIAGSLSSLAMLRGFNASLRFLRDMKVPHVLVDSAGRLHLN